MFLPTIVILRSMPITAVDESIDEKFGHEKIICAVQ